MSSERNRASCSYGLGYYLALGSADNLISERDEVQTQWGRAEQGHRKAEWLEW